MKKLKGNLTEHLTIDDYGVNQTETVTITPEALVHAKMLEEFIVWMNWKNRPSVNAWARTAAYNKKVGGISTSNHLKGTATDLGVGEFTDERFNKYARKWEEICKKYGVVGEIGRYPWGIHLGSHITYSKKFTVFDKR